MLIISKFRDYYDTAIAYGIDKECAYDRKNEVILTHKRNKHRQESTHEFENKNYKYVFTNYTLGFCGEVYRIVTVFQKDKWNYSNDKLIGFYDAQSMIDYMKEHDIGLKEVRFRWHSWSRNRWQSETEVKEYFDKEIKQTTYDLFRKHYVPIWIAGYNYIELNPVLKDYKFAKVKDAFTAFQAIHQYMAGVLGNKEKDTINISDKIRIKQHGFDKWSFKTHKEDAKKNISKRKKKKS